MKVTEPYIIRVKDTESHGYSSDSKMNHYGGGEQVMGDNHKQGESGLAYGEQESSSYQLQQEFEKRQSPQQLQEQLQQQKQPQSQSYAVPENNNDGALNGYESGKRTMVIAGDDNRKFYQENGYSPMQFANYLSQYQSQQQRQQQPQHQQLQSSDDSFEQVQQFSPKQPEEQQAVYFNIPPNSLSSRQQPAIETMMDVAMAESPAISPLSSMVPQEQPRRENLFYSMPESARHQQQLPTEQQHHHAASVETEYRTGHLLTSPANYVQNGAQVQLVQQQQTQFYGNDGSQMLQQQYETKKK